MQSPLSINNISMTIYKTCTGLSPQYESLYVLRPVSPVQVKSISLGTIILWDPSLFKGAKVSSYSYSVVLLVSVQRKSISMTRMSKIPISSTTHLMVIY